MKPAAAIFSLLCALTLWALPAQAQEHAGGDGAFSRDGSLLAFYQEGRPQGEFVVLEVASGRSFRFVMEAPLARVRDLVWAPASNTLAFVSFDLQPPGGAIPQALNLQASTVWSMAFTADGPQPARVIARGEDIHAPALSHDGARLAYFDVVRLPNEAPDKRVQTSAAFAVFEADLATGDIVRVAPSQYLDPKMLFYDGADAWLFNAREAAYARENRGSHFWSSARPGAPGGQGTFDQLTGGIKSFRMVRGEALPAYPATFQTYPVMGIAPLHARLVGITQDGGPILHDAPGAENTAANQQRNTASWYVRGVSRVPMQEGFIAYRKADAPEVYYPPSQPPQFTNYSGGMGVDGAMKRYFAIRMTPYPTPTDYGLTTSRLFLYEDQTLIIERNVSDIIMKAEKVAIAE